ncbi:hypothetical protein [Xanthomonas sacchari]|uniref:hypothetical protein n=1 Tax=Xanthomonas sacchari TaxID=56458 RepID=UPI00225B9AB1|nr:hypothetical protein [Xanthomonas sacchari]
MHERQTNIRGPKSSKLKYKKTLCAKCNNERSQPWDKAYDSFVSWVLDNEEEIIRRRLINFETIFGSSFAEGQLNLSKYFVKSFGCRFVDAEIPVPADLVELLPLEHFLTALKISFAVNEDVQLLPKKSRDRLLAKGEMAAWDSEDNDPSRGYTWDEGLSWLTVKYWYGVAPDGELGCPWIANSKFLYLGSYQPLSEMERTQMLLRLQEPETAQSDC